MAETAPEHGVYVTETGEEIPRVWTSFSSGKIPWSDLDDEELQRGTLRNKAGHFSGRPKTLLPREVVNEVRRRLNERYHERIAASLLELQDVFLGIAKDDQQSAADRLRAAQYMTERLIGKVPDKVEVTAEVKPWEGLVAGVLEERHDPGTNSGGSE